MGLSINTPEGELVLHKGVSVSNAKKEIKKVLSKGKITLNALDHLGTFLVEKDVEVPTLVASPHATISVLLTSTRQVVQYEPIKCGVTVTLPCANDDTEIQNTYEKAKDLANEMMGKLLDEVIG